MIMFWAIPSISIILKKRYLPVKFTGKYASVKYYSTWNLQFVALCIQDMDHAGIKQNN